MTWLNVGAKIPHFRSCKDLPVSRQNTIQHYLNWPGTQADQAIKHSVGAANYWQVSGDPSTSRVRPCRAKFTHPPRTHARTQVYIACSMIDGCPEMAAAMTRGPWLTALSTSTCNMPIYYGVVPLPPYGAWWRPRRVVVALAPATCAGRRDAAAKANAPPPLGFSRPQRHDCC
jgi:hypothetical protein